MNTFIPITKVDLARQEVWGWAAIEEVDNSDEIMDYASSKPLWEDWSRKAQKRSGGKSLGNLRVMHQDVAAGKLIELRPDDDAKGFWVGARIIDDQEWKKVEEGVYTGFSVGGSYERRWMDHNKPGVTRYTARPAEVSIVDSPCIQSATFEVIKADGMTERRQFVAGNGENTMKVVDEDLTKAIPGAPEPLADIPLDSEVGPDFEATHMPEPNDSLPIDPAVTQPPGALAQAAVKSQDLTAEFEKWLPRVGTLVRQEVAKALDDRGLTKSEQTTDSPAGRIRVVNNK